MTNFVTKDSGERQTFSTGMVRDTGAKELRPDLVYVPMLRRWQDTMASKSDSVSERKEEAFQSFITWFSDDESQEDHAAEVFAAIDDVERLLEHGPMLVRWAELMGRGAIKYGERNWEKARTAEELARFKASAFRHLVQWFFGLNKEEDHAAAVFFNVAGAEYVRERMADDALYEATITFKLDGIDAEKIQSSLLSLNMKGEVGTINVSGVVYQEDGGESEKPKPFKAGDLVIFEGEERRIHSCCCEMDGRSTCGGFNLEPSGKKSSYATIEKLSRPKSGAV